MRPFLEIAELVDGRFCVVSIDPTKRIDGGCEAIVRSIHGAREEAEMALAKHQGTNPAAENAILREALRGLKDLLVLHIYYFRAHEAVWRSQVSEGPDETEASKHAEIKALTAREVADDTIAAVARIDKILAGGGAGA